MAKVSEFKVIVDSDKPDIIFITETWLKFAISDSLVDLPGYLLFREDRKIKGGGGVCIYVKQRINGFRTECRRVASMLHDSILIDCVFVKIRIKAAEILLGCIYRPPDCSLEENQNFCQAFEMLTNCRSDILMFGDFNYREIDWNRQEIIGSSEAAEQFLGAYQSLHLHQLIDFPTRFRVNNTPSLIDLLLTTDEKLITGIESRSPVGKSDHVIIVATLQVSVTTSQTKSQPHLNYWKADYAAIREHLRNTELDQRATKYDSMMDVFQDLQKYVPSKAQKTKGRKPWVIKSHKTLINKKRRLWHRYRDTGSRGDYELYREASNHVTGVLRDARKRYEETLIDRGPREFYRYINSTLNSRIQSFALYDAAGDVTTKPETVCEIFADYFESTFVKEDLGSMPSCPPDTRSIVSIEDVTFTSEGVLKALSNQKQHSSPGPDGIPAVFLVRSAPAVETVLTAVFEESFEQGKLPDAWKSSIIVPIHKKGDKLSPSNYRPISLTSIACKCMERIIARELTEFITEHHRFSFLSQHGFLPRRSVVSNLLSCLEAWTQAQDEGYPIDVVYVDFAKAFDTVPLRRLLLKLEHMGVRGRLLVWLQDYLTNRKFQVRIDGCLSEKRVVTSGVPQGSVLGPLLFLIYVSDLPSGMVCRTSLFADDTKLFGDPSIQHGQITEDLAELESWTNRWLIKLNADKCSILHIGFNNPKLTYYVNEHELGSVEQQTDLGVTISGDLKWGAHIVRIVKRANSTTYLINRAFSGMSERMCRKVYVTYVRPLLEHAVVVWSPYFQKDIDLLERVQRRFTKLTPALRGRPYSERLEVLKLPTLYDRRRRGDLIETYKILHGHYSSDIDFFQRNMNPQLRGHSLKLVPVKWSRLSRKNILYNRVVNDWNNLTEEIVSAPSINNFKNRLDNYWSNV